MLSFIVSIVVSLVMVLLLFKIINKKYYNKKKKNLEMLFALVILTMIILPFSNAFFASHYEWKRSYCDEFEIEDTYSFQIIKNKDTIIYTPNLNITEKDSDIFIVVDDKKYYKKDISVFLTKDDSVTKIKKSALFRDLDNDLIVPKFSLLKKDVKYELYLANTKSNEVLYNYIFTGNKLDSSVIILNKNNRKIEL